MPDTGKEIESRLRHRLARQHTARDLQNHVHPLSAFVALWERSILNPRRTAANARLIYGIELERFGPACEQICEQFDRIPRAYRPERAQEARIASHILGRSKLVACFAALRQLSRHRHQAIDVSSQNRLRWTGAQEPELDVVAYFNGDCPACPGLDERWHRNTPFNVGSRNAIRPCQHSTRRLLSAEVFNPCVDSFQLLNASGVGAADDLTPLPIEADQHDSQGHEKCRDCYRDGDFQHAKSHELSALWRS